MAIIPKQDTLTDIIEKGMVKLEHREYIGMSGLAGKCQRKIWYDFHWANDRMVPKRIKRIFDRGDLEEARVVEDLIAADMRVKNVLSDQTEVVDDTGHIKGHPDGVVIQVPTAPKTEHLLEIKTMNNKRFKDYVKNGLERTNPPYWGQVHTYMGKMKLTRCLFVVSNKDDETRHYERINYDKEVHDYCMDIGHHVLTAYYPPKKIGESTWFECKMCDSSGICHKGDPIKRTCRSCQHFNTEMEGKFSCDLLSTKYSNHWLNKHEQEKACDDYELSEVF